MYTYFSSSYIYNKKNYLNDNEICTSLFIQYKKLDFNLNLL